MAQISDADRRRMDEVTAGVQDNKSEKMRRLAAAGFSRGDIARYLGVRYQFVRNVMVAAEQAVEAAELAKGTVTESRASAGTAMLDYEMPGEVSRVAPGWLWTRVGRGGSIVLPAHFLEALGVAEGGQVQLALEGDVVRIVGRTKALRDLQEDVRRYVPEGISLVDELLAERRAEAVRDTKERGDG